MKTVEVGSVRELVDTLNCLPNNFIFRGQADAGWLLESSLERLIGPAWSAPNAERFETFSLDQFRSKFHLYDRENTEPDSKLAWLSLMQHYGVPTRLLDFTESPYVALYFALEGYSPRSKVPLALYAIDYTAVLERSLDHIRTRDASFSETRASLWKRQDEVFEAVVDPSDFEIAWITEPKRLNARLDRQGGTFLLSGSRGIRIRDVLDAALYSNVSISKYIIPATCYEGIFVLLRKMNITSKSLYGDLNGLGRGIRMEMAAYTR